MKKSIFFGFLISAICLYFAFRNVQISEFIESFQRVDLFILAIGVAVVTTALWLRGWRWRLLLDPLNGEIDTHSAFAVLNISLMWNNIVPARLGELARIYLMEKRGVSKSSALATVFVDRILDGFALFIFLGILVVVQPVPLPDWAEDGAWSFSIFYGVLTLGLLFIYFGQSSFQKMCAALDKAFSVHLGEKAYQLVEKFNEGLRPFRRGRLLGGASLVSLLVWIFEGVIIFILLKSAGIEATFEMSLFVLIALTLATMVPSAPGFVGTIQFASVISLSLFNIDRELALVFSVLFQFVTYIPSLPLGLFYTFKQGFKYNPTLKPSN